MAEIEYHFEVFDGRGIATVWTARKYLSGRVELIECVGTLYGVHTEREAREAWAGENR